MIAPEGSRARCLYDHVTDYIRRRNPKGRAAVVHRIDRDTSGLVLFAKDGRTKTELMKLWNELVKKRSYLAIVRGQMEEDKGRIESWLRENAGGEVYQTEAGATASLKAITEYKTLYRGTNLSLVELELETGRKHQIRVQMSGIGHPVLGDPKYGHSNSSKKSTRPERSNTNNARLYLHATALSFIHPWKKTLIELTDPPPDAFLIPLGGWSRISLPFPG